jgi:hypothetical protein
MGRPAGISDGKGDKSHLRRLAYMVLLPMDETVSVAAFGRRPSA